MDGVIWGLTGLHKSRFGSSLIGECFPKRNVETTSSTLNLRVPYQIYSKPWTSYWFKFCWARELQHVSTCNMYNVHIRVHFVVYIIIFVFYTCRMYPYHSISRFSSLLFFPWPQGCLDKSNLERPSWSSVLYLGDIGGPTMILDQAPWFFVVFGCFRPGSVVEFWVFLVHLAIHSKIYMVFLGRTQKVDQTKCRVWAFPVGWGLQLTTALI